MIVLIILLIIAIAVAIYYRSKAKEFESLFELSKSYEYPEIVFPPRLNKDSSIAKKRGRKSNVKTT